jgi:acetyl esterase
VLDEIASAGGGENAKPSIDEMRRLQLVEARFSGEPQAVAAVRDVHIESPSGSTRVRLYVPDSSGPHPTLLFLHGGGWALGSIELSDPLCRALCHASRMLIASVEYRLAPEHPFPAGLDDAYAALRWLSANGPEIGAIPGKLAVCGDSAGGNLAAAVSLMSRDRSGPELALQVLIYPALDPTLSEASMQTLSAGYGLTAGDMQLFWDLYLKSPDDAAKPYASPLRETNLKGVAPALIITAEYDPLVDEGERYGVQLGDAGVPARTVRYPGMIHGFMSYLGRVDAASAGVAECANALGHAMGTQLRSS